MDITEIIGGAIVSPVSEWRVATFIQCYEPRVVSKAMRVPLGWLWRGFINTDTRGLVRILTVNSRDRFREAVLQCAILEIDGILFISDTAVSLIRIEQATRDYAQANPIDWQDEFRRD